MANNAAQEICQNKGQTSRLLFSVCAAEEGWDTHIRRTVTVNAQIQFFCMIKVRLDLLRCFLDWRDNCCWRPCDVPLDGELLVDLSNFLHRRHGTLQTSEKWCPNVEKGHLLEVIICNILYRGVRKSDGKIWILCLFFFFYLEIKCWVLKNEDKKYFIFCSNFFNFLNVSRSLI